MKYVSWILDSKTHEISKCPSDKIIMWTTLKLQRKEEAENITFMFKNLNTSMMFTEKKENKFSNI